MNRRYSLIVLALLVVIGGCGPKAMPIPEAQQALADEIKAAGGLVGVNREDPNLGITSANLQSLPIDDAFVKRLVSTMPGLMQLNLRRTKVTDASVPEILKLQGLTALDIAETAISARGSTAIAEGLPDAEVKTNETEAEFAKEGT